MKNIVKVLFIGVIMLASVFFISAGDVIFKPTNVELNQDLTVGTNTLYVDSANNRVGIGTTTPNEELTVNGNISLVGKSHIYNENNDVFIESRDAGSDLIFESDRDILFRKESDNTLYMTLYRGGLLGIGITVPTEEIQIDKSNGRLLITDAADSSGNRVMLGDDSARGGFINLYDESEAAKVYLSATQSSFLNGGNVGIGTTSPLALLHLDTTESADSDQLIIESEDNSIGEYDQIVFRATGGINSTGIRTEITASGDKSLQFLTTTDDTTASEDMPVRMTIDHSGNVGIGTTSPTTLLDISPASSHAQLKLKPRGGSNTEAHIYLDRLTTSALAGIDFLTNGAGKMRIGLADDGTDNFYIGTEGFAAKYVTIDNNTGNVGIGTTNPKARLHVSSVIKSEPTDSPGACNSDTEGGMYYDASLNEPCFCDGSNWKQFDGGGNC